MICMSKKSLSDTSHMSDHTGMLDIRINYTLILADKIRELSWTIIVFFLAKRPYIRLGVEASNAISRRVLTPIVEVTIVLRLMLALKKDG